jgi:hypothetical protein
MLDITHLNRYLKLLQDTRLFLAQHLQPVLSEPADCEFFRQKFKESLARKKAAPPKPVEKLVESPVERQAPKEYTPPTPSAIPTAQPLKPSPVEQVKPTLPEKETSPPPVVQPISSAPIPKPRAVESKIDPALSAQDSLQWPVLSLGKWKTVMSKVAPELHILSEVPSDAMARKIASRWKTKNLSAPITILSYQEIPEQKALLEQITLALDVHFCPAKLVSAETIEKEQQWEAFLSVDELRLIITCDYTLWQMPGLLKFYKESPSRRQIGEKDLFLLPDLSLYLKDPLLKRSLWKALNQVICQTCEPLLPLSSSTKI